MVFREAKESELPELIEIIYLGQNSWGREVETKKELLTRITKDFNHKKYFVLKEGPEAKEIIGLSIFFEEKYSLKPRTGINQSNGHLGSFYLLKKYWQTGKATTLMGLTIQEMRQEGFKEGRLWTPEIAKRAQAFYSKTGWVKTGQTTKFKDLTRVEFIKDLT